MLQLPQGRSLLDGLPVPFRVTEADLPGRSTKAANSTCAGERTKGSATKWKRCVNIEKDFVCPEDKFRRNTRSEGTDCSQGNSKKLEGEEPNGHGPLLLSRGIMFNVQALAVFNAEQEDVSPAHRCAPAAEKRIRFYLRRFPILS